MPHAQGLSIWEEFLLDVLHAVFSARGYALSVALPAFAEVPTRDAQRAPDGGETYVAGGRGLQKHLLS